MKDNSWKDRYKDDRIVQEYDGKRYNHFIGRIMNRLDLKMIEKAMKVFKKGAKVYMPACGTGRFLPDFTKKGFKVIASDISPQMIEYTRNKFKDCEGMIGFENDDLEELKYEDKFFDCSVVIRFIHLVNEEETRIKILNELQRVTKDWLIITFHHKYTLKYFVSILRGKKLPGKLSRKQVMQTVKKSGLNLVNIYTSTPLLSSSWVLLLKP